MDAAVAMTEETDEEVPLVTKLRRELRARERELRQLREQSANSETAEKMLAVLEASGGTLKPAQVKAVLKMHEGDDWSPEALKETVTQLGFAQSAPFASEMATLARMGEAAAGAGIAPPRVDGVNEIEAIDINDPQYTEKVMAVVQKHGGNTSWGNQ